MTSKPLARALLTLLLAVQQVPAGAATGEIELPPERVSLRPSRLPGFTLATQKCAICHSADYVAYQPPGMNRAQWIGEVTKMQHTYGAPIDDKEIPLIAAYLTATYGDARSLSAADLAQETGRPPPVAGPAAGVEDVPALLAKNACLGCHALQQKVVGPAYHDVAARYRDDPQALAKVAASIREGGSGRWGTVAMPPFRGLSEPQLKALAGFVLGQ